MKSASIFFSLFSIVMWNLLHVQYPKPVKDGQYLVELEV